MVVLPLAEPLETYEGVFRGFLQGRIDHVLSIRQTLVQPGAGDSESVAYRYLQLISRDSHQSGLVNAWFQHFQHIRALDPVPLTSAGGIAIKDAWLAWEMILINQVPSEATKSGSDCCSRRDADSNFIKFVHVST